METAFWILLTMLTVWTFAKSSERAQSFSRKASDWVIDLTSLAIHLWGLPLIQTLILLRMFEWIVPQYRGSVSVGPFVSLGLYVLLDYLWYWNHRLLHSYTWIWNLHAVHHSAKQVDVFTTARNSVWSHVFEIYIWFIAGMLYLARDPSWFVTIVILGSMSNFWTHTMLTFPRMSKAYRWASFILITPHEHLWHHSTSHSNTNFATVFSIWDRWHGTLHAPEELPELYGNEYIENPVLQLVLPVPPFAARLKK